MLEAIEVKDLAHHAADAEHIADCPPHKREIPHVDLG